MTPAGAQSLVILATGTAVTLTTISTMAQGKRPPARVYIGGAIAAVMLAGAAEFIPDIVGPLAGVVLITAVFVRGAPAYRALSNLTRK